GLGGGYGTLRFQTSSDVTREASVLVQVGGVSLPQIEVDPLSLDLRGAGPGRPVTRTLTIRNLGAELTLQVQLSLTPSAAGPNFTVEDSQGDVLSRVVGVQAQRSV